jgi:hypothetical protein
VGHAEAAAATAAAAPSTSGSRWHSMSDIDPMALILPLVGSEICWAGKEVLGWLSVSRCHPPAPAPVLILTL